MKEKKMLFGIGIAFLFLATVSLSYAYFTATLINKDVKDQIVTTGTLELTYIDGPEIVMNNIKPGATITKEISVKNTGTLNTSYNLVWQELANEIIDDEIVIEATCTRYNGNTIEGTCDNLSSTPIKKIKIKENVSIESNITHKYNITITFKEANADQNYNQGKNFTGTLGINEYVENTPIYCTFDGDMVQGAEYVNGQYTYHYMQQGIFSSSSIAWENISVDGWGVQLTDRENTDPVTTKLCTYINNKPIVSMSYMFVNSQAKSIDLSSFNTSNIINMDTMFTSSQVRLIDLSKFDTSKVTNMSNMFGQTNITFLDISNFDTSNVTDMSFMFQQYNNSRLDIRNFDTSNVVNMSYMFDGSAVTSLDLSSFDTSKVVSMWSMFSKSKVEELDLSNFNTSNVTDMGSMFNGSQLKTINLSNFDTSKVEHMDWMFSNSTNLETIYVSGDFDTSSVTDSEGMFSACNNLVGGNGTKYNILYRDKTYARIDGGTSSPGYFTLKNN